MRTSLFCLATAVSLSGCGSLPDTLDPDDDLLHEALQGTGTQRPALQAPVAESPPPATQAPPQRQLIRGNQAFVRQPAAPANVPQQGGDIVFNFADQPIEAVINSVMGDLLHENYSIAEGVKGTVSFSTSKPVDKQQALSILETLLSWTDNAMIKQGNRYVILPANQAVAGKLVPQMRVAQPASGLSARLFSLRYISATEMQKLLKPFARENAFLLVDPARNVLSLAGTPDELANYQDTNDTFDVDWLKGMSVAVPATRLGGRADARAASHVRRGQWHTPGRHAAVLAGRAHQLGGGDFFPAPVPHRSGRLDPHHRRGRRQRAADVCVRRAQYEGRRPRQVPAADLR